MRLSSTYIYLRLKKGVPRCLPTYLPCLISLHVRRLRPKERVKVDQCAAYPCPLPGQPRRAENSVPNTRYAST